MKSKKQIIVVGGGFNPPTSAHITIIKTVIATCAFDELWLMPSGKRHDKSFAVTDQERLGMLQLVVDEVIADKRVMVNDFELRQPQPTETYNTHNSLLEMYPDHTFTYVFGADSYWTMEQWENGSWLKQHLSMVIFSRQGQEAIVAPNVQYIEGITDEGVSSTLVRQRVAKNEPIEDLVNPLVARYVYRHQLYLE